MTDKVICQQCRNLGQRSKVYMPGCSFTTLMADEHYYDEDGNYHHHDPNASTLQYRCNRGHSWTEVSYGECPSCDYNKGRGRTY